LADWDERLAYAQKLTEAGDEAGARTALSPALADCDPDLRAEAEALLEGTFNRPGFWERVRDAVSDDRNIAIKAIVGILGAGALYLAGLSLRNALNRKRLGINPLAVTGLGFSGAQFVDIVSDMFFRADRLDRLQRGIRRNLRETTDTPVVTVGMARLTLDRTPKVVDAMTTAAEAISGDAGKLATIMLKLIKEPCYQCSGSLSISGNDVYILIRLERRGRIIERWEKTNLTMPTLIGDLQDLALLILQTAAQDMDRRERWLRWR
jgi:hypothetical protein